MNVLQADLSEDVNTADALRLLDVTARQLHAVLDRLEDELEAEE